MFVFLVSGAVCVGVFMSAVSLLHLSVFLALPLFFSLCLLVTVFLSLSCLLRGIIAVISSCFSLLSVVVVGVLHGLRGHSLFRALGGEGWRRRGSNHHLITQG